MAKTPSSRLFDLVKSLSGSERRYFKLANKKDSDSKYLLLFEAIEGQKVFDDNQLQKTVYNNQLIKGKKYSELKAYLYQLILKNLQQFDEQTSVDYQLKSMLLSARSLFRRLQYDDCRYVLNKAKKIAIRYECFLSVLEIINWEKELAYAESDVDYFDKNLESILEEEEGSLAKIAQIKTYEKLFYQTFVMVRTNRPQAEDVQVKIEQITNHKLLVDETVPNSFKAQVFYLRIKAILAYQRRDIHNFYQGSKDVINLVETKPFLLKEDVSHYISALSNLASSCGLIGNLDEMRECLKKLKKVKPNTLDDELKIHRQYYTNYFRLCINTAKFKEGELVLKKHLEEVKKLNSKVFQRNVFFYQYFYIYFGLGDFDKALTYLNEWLSLPKSIDQQDLQILARILNLIVHYEMGNSILLESLLKSTQRSLQKVKRYNAFEHTFFQCLRQANNLTNKEEKQAIFKATGTKLSDTDWSARERAMLRFFDFEAWLLSKAQNRSFASVVKQSI